MDAIGGYQLLGRVSENRQLSVWKGRDPVREREVALKQVELTVVDVIDRFRLQARVLAGISHPGIVEVFGVVEDADHAWLVEDWVTGDSLAAVLEAGGPLTPEQSLGVVTEALTALAHAHEHAIVHGNISAATVLIDGDGAVRLTNFGGESPLSASTDRLAEPVTPRSDVYLAGALLSALLPEPPAEIRAVQQRAMAADPSERYRDAAQFRAELEAASTSCFGADWRSRSDMSARIVLAATPTEVADPVTPIVNGFAEVPTNRGSSVTLSGPPASKLQVRRPSAPPTHTADIRDLIEPRSRRLSREANPGRFIPIVAGVVVIAAIIILVVTHHDKATATEPGLAFHGTYTVSTMLQTAGVGADSGRLSGSVASEQWKVTPSCPSSGQCSAQVIPLTGSPFTLTFINGSWTGERAMSADSNCVGAYSLTLTGAAGEATGQKLTGRQSGVAGGCSQAGTESNTITVTRASG